MKRRKHRKCKYNRKRGYTARRKRHYNRRKRKNPCATLAQRKQKRTFAGKWARGRCNNPSVKFKDLSVGQSFDFIGPERMYNSFYLRCTKTGPRTYRDENGVNHRIGSASKAEVFHVGRK
jgi:hypothetical protein